jgi:hypothetical protein
LVPLNSGLKPLLRPGASPPTGYRRLGLAESDYDLRARESFAFDQSKERYSIYLLLTGDFSDWPCSSLPGLLRH